MTPEWITEAEKLYKQGMPYYKIGEKLCVSRKTVSYHLRKIGYQSNQSYVRKIDPKKLSKYDYTYAETIFKNIDTEEKAYWLGFLYADGAMDDNKSAVTLSLKEEDKATVEKFRSFCGLESKPLHKKIKKGQGKKYISYEFCIQNKNIFNDLVSLGCTTNKTFTLTFPDHNQVPSDLIHHFIRGYLDGDGSVTHGGKGSTKISIEILGTKKFLGGYQNWTKIPHKLYKFNHSNILRSIYGGANAICILDRLYENATVYMERKHDKYLRLRRLAVTSSKRTARSLAGKIGEGLGCSIQANTEVTSV